MTINDTDRRK